MLHQNSFVVLVMTLTSYLFVLLPSQCSSFQSVSNVPGLKNAKKGLNHGWLSSPSSSTLSSSCLYAEQALATPMKTTLDEETTWRIQFVMNGLTTKNNKKVNEIFTVYCKFEEEIDYEPPQGFLRIVNGDEGESEEEVPTSRLSFKNSYWKLSEDPDDPQWGLWVWGLFKEPLYPFLLLQITTDEIPLVSNNDDEEDDAILPLQLYAQVNHKRDKEQGGVVLDRNTDLKVRTIITQNADILGATQVDVKEDTSVGTVRIEPMR